MMAMYSDIVSGNLSVYEVRSYEEDPLLMPRWGYVVSAFVLFLIGFFGFFLNLLVIILMFKDRQLWTPLNIILFNLVCSDFSVSVLGNPFTLISTLSHGWVFGERMCVLYGFFMALLGITSITTLTVLSFERYMMVSRPFSARHLTSRGACLTILLIWSYSLALTTPPLFGWGKYVSEAANISCSVNWQEQTFNALTYILFLFAMGQVVPCAIIGFSYFNILRTMKQNAARMGRVNRGEAQVTAMVFIMIVAFMVAWTPYSVLALLEQFAENGMISPGVGVIPALIAKSSICYDPLIYVGMNTQYRSSIKRMFGIHSKEANDNGEHNTVMSYAGKLNRNDTKIKAAFPPIISNMKARKEAIVEGAMKKGNNDGGSSEAHRFSETESLENGVDDKPSGMTTLKSFQETKPKKSMVGYENDTFVNTNDEELGENEDFESCKGNVKFESVERPISSKIKHSCSMEIARVTLDPSFRKMSIPVVFDSRNNSITNSLVRKLVDRNNRHDLENFKTLLFTTEKCDADEDCL